MKRWKSAQQNFYADVRALERDLFSIQACSLEQTGDEGVALRANYLILTQQFISWIMFGTRWTFAWTV